MIDPTRIVVFAVSFLLISNVCFGEDSWSMFRGPNGSGVAKSTLPADLSLESNLLWKAAVPKGYSSPVLWDGKIFLTAAEGDQLLTICIDQSTGKEVWRATAPRDRTEKLDHRNHASAASAVVDSDSVVVFFGDYGMICYSHDGAERWRLPLGPFTNIYGMGASPIIVGDRVILVCDQNNESFIVGVDKTTGEIAWKTERSSATSGHCTPIVYRPKPSEPPQIIVAGSFYVTAYSAANGDKLWWVGGLCFEMKSTPVIFEDLLFINGFGSPYNQPDNKVEVSPFNSVVEKQDANKNGVLEQDEMPDAIAKAFFEALDLNGNKSLDLKEWKYFQASMASENSMMAMTLGGTGDMTQSNVRWKCHRSVPQLPSPVAVDKRLYMISDRGIVTNFVAETGKINVRGRLKGASGNYYASPLVAGNQVLFLSTGGKLTFVPVDDELNVVNLIDFKEPCYATPAVAGERIYVRTNQSLYCLGKSE